MDKIIKEIIDFDNNYTYRLGYNIKNNKVHPQIDIYKNYDWISGCAWTNSSDEDTTGIFFFQYSYLNSNVTLITRSLNKIFIELKKYNKISEEIKKEYEKLFLLYKLNDFNEF